MIGPTGGPAGLEAVQRDRNIASVRLFLALLEKKDIDSWITLWADDAFQFYPYGTAMFPPTLRGRTAVYERWRAMPEMFDELHFPLRAVWADGDTVVAQFDGDCVRLDGSHYRNSYIGLFRFTAAGLIHEYWEYFDAIVAGVGLGMADVSYRDQG
jgi:ketosteroid isomerase-like protein